MIFPNEGAAGERRSRASRAFTGSMACLISVLAGAACAGEKPANAPRGSSVELPSAPPAEVDGTASSADAASPEPPEVEKRPSSAPPPAAGVADAPSGAESDACAVVSLPYEKSVRPALKQCYADAKKKEPNLEGSVKLVLNVDGLGKTTIKPQERMGLPVSVERCMVQVLKKSPFDAKPCANKTVTITMQFPTR